MRCGERVDMAFFPLNKANGSIKHKSTLSESNAFPYMSHTHRF